MKPIRIPGEESASIGGVRLLQWMSMIGLIALFGIVYVWQQVQTRDLKRDILQLETRKGKLAEENTRLGMQVARLSSSDVIQPLARDLLQLDYPAIGQVLTVPDREPSADQQSPIAPARATLPSASWSGRN